MDAEGLTVIDTTDVLTGNTDIACERETPRPDNADTRPSLEHLAGVEWEPLPKFCPWLTENRAFAIAGALAVVGMFLGAMA